jgi:hypothetical protein
MAQVTGGLVSIEDGIKKAEEYAPPRKVRVELSFGVGEGETFETIFDTVSQAAANRVASLLGGTALNVVAGPTADTPAGEPQRRTRRTKAQIEADEAARKAGASQTGDAGGVQTSDDPTDGADPVIHLPDETAEDDFSIEPEPETPAEESFDIEPAAEDPKAEAITDADLNSAVQKKNAEIANPNAIRALIGGYNPDPKSAFQLRQIPPEKRPEFLTKLGALTKAA